MIPRTQDRVPEHAAGRVNRRIRHATERNIARYGNGPKPAIRRRLKELDREWDIERTLEANAAAIALAGIGLAFLVDRRWLLLPAAVAAFLLEHAVQGWCPPVPVFRRLGVRTSKEIRTERDALKVLRGDFDRLRDGKRRNIGRMMAVLESS